MPNFDYLLGGQVAQVDPMRIALQGATLADIASQARVRQMLLEKHQRDMQAQDDLNAVLPQVMSAGWSPQALQAAVQSRPGSAGSLLDMLDKKRASDATYAKTSAEAEAKSTDSAVAKLKPLTAQAYALANKPGPLTPDEIKGLYGNIAGNGLQNLVVNLPFKDWTNEASVRDNLRTIGSAFFEAEKQASQALAERKFTQAELPKSQAETNKANVEAGLAPFIANTGRISANASASNAQTNRMQYTNPNLQHVSDPNSGQLYTFNPKGGAFGAAADAAGVPLPKTEKPLTESQGNATAYGMRMKYSNDIINGLEQSGFDLSSLPNRYLPESVIGNYIADPKAQQAYQAKLNFMTASLRKESGAVISPSEFASEEKKYFPQPGDSPQMMAQKAQARALALDAMSIQAGPGSSKVNAVQGGGNYTSGKIVQSLPDPTTLAPGTRVRDTKTGNVMVAGPNGYTMEK